MFPYASGQPNPLGWLPGPHGGGGGTSESVHAQSNPGTGSLSGLPMISGPQLAALQAAAGLPFMGGALGAGAFGMPGLSSLLGAGPHGAALPNATSQQSLSSMSMPTTSHQQQQQHQQQQHQQQQLALAAAAALMSQMQCAAPPPAAMQSSGPDMGHNPAAMSPWALLLAQHAAAGLLPALPPELLAQQAGYQRQASGPAALCMPLSVLPSGMDGATAAGFQHSHGPPSSYLGRQPASPATHGIAPSLAQQQHSVGPAPVSQQQLRMQPEGSMSPSSSSPVSESPAPASGASHPRTVRAQRSGARSADGRASQPDSATHSKKRAGRSHAVQPVVDSALVEHSQRGTSEELSSASGCSQAPPPTAAATAAAAAAAPSRNTVQHSGMSKQLHSQQQQQQAFAEEEQSQHKVPHRSSSTSMRASRKAVGSPPQQHDQLQQLHPGAAVAAPCAMGPPPLPRLSHTAGSAGSAGAAGSAGVTGGGAGARLGQHTNAAAAMPGVPAVSLQAHMQGMLGPQQWSRVRTTLLRQQTTFVQQLYELHKLNSLQKLLCLEVLGFDPASQSAGGRPFSDGGGMGMGPGPSNSCMSLPSVCAPAPHNGGGHSAGGGGRGQGGGGTGADAGAGGEPSCNMLQRVQQDLAQMANIPTLLRSKAKTGFPSDNMASPKLASGPATGLGPADAGVPRVVKPVAMRPVAAVEADRTTVVQKAAGQHSPSPVTAGGNPADAGALAPSAAAAPGMPPLGTAAGGGGLLEAATALLQQTGGLVPPLPALAPGGLAGSSRPATGGAKPPFAMPLAMGAGPARNLPMGVPPPLLPGAAGAMSFLPPAPALQTNLQAAPPMMDPHSAWFTKHFTNPAAPPAGTSAPPSAAGAARAVGADGAAAAAGGASNGGGPAALAAPLRWWHDEAAVFGEVTPSMVGASMSDGSGVNPQVTLGSKRTAKQAGNGVQPSGNNSKKSRHEAGDNMGSPDGSHNPRAPSAFKVVRPHKARSKRGSNRLGPHGTRDSSVVSDDSGSSMNQQHNGSCIMGMSCAAGPPMSVVSGGSWGAASGARPHPLPHSPRDPAAAPPLARAAATAAERPEAAVAPAPANGNGERPGSGRRRSGGSNGNGFLGCGGSAHGVGAHMPPMMAGAEPSGGGGHAQHTYASGGSGPSGHAHGSGSGPTTASEDKERSAAKLLLSLSCATGASGGHGSILQGMQQRQQQVVMSQLQHGLMAAAAHAAHDALGGSDGNGQAMSVSA